MGEYYDWVNVDLKEYISPHDFDYGNKCHESMCRGNNLLGALRELLASDWKGCQIIWMGDEVSSWPRDKDSEICHKLYKQTVESGYPGMLNDIVDELYTDVAGAFAGTEKSVSEEIELLKREMEAGECDSKNYYGIDLNEPYKGLFKRKGRDFKYTVNYTKKVCYSFDTTRILLQNGQETDRFDPLPLLMGFGEVLEEPGEWFGDIIGVSDVLPDGITVLESICLDW